MVHMSENEQEQVAIEIAVDCQQQQSISKSGPKDKKFKGVSGVTGNLIARKYYRCDNIS